MVDFLRVFEAKALASALTEAGHSVSERTVQRWKAGVTKPKPQDIRAIYNVIRLRHNETAAPDWAAAMELRLTEALMANRSVFVETMATHFAKLGVERALDEQTRSGPDPETQGAGPGRAVPK